MSAVAILKSHSETNPEPFLHSSEGFSLRHQLNVDSGHSKSDNGLKFSKIAMSLCEWSRNFRACLVLTLLWLLLCGGVSSACWSTSVYGYVPLSTLYMSTRLRDTIWFMFLQAVYALLFVDASPRLA